MSQDTSDQETGDAVDRIVEQWRRERPDLDPGAKHVTGRIVRLSSLFQQRFGDAFAPHGIGEGDYGVLAALRRAGEPYRLTPTELCNQRMMTSGGMTSLVDRLERAGFVDRSPNPADRRGSLVGLTATGLAAVDAAMVDHAAAEAELVASVSERERGQLERLLRKLLRSIDPA